MIGTLLLPALEAVECPDCQGYGYVGDEYDGHSCNTCDAWGKVERCSGCHETPTVVNGADSCGCTASTLELGRAA